MWKKILDFFKKETVQVLSEVEDSFVRVTDYPSNLFKAYWETHILPRERDFYAQIRFISLETHEALNTIELVFKTQEELLKEVSKAIKTEMSKYTR